MDELAYDIFRAVKCMYTSLHGRTAYLRAVKDGLLTKDDRELVLEFHTVR